MPTDLERLLLRLEVQQSKFEKQLAKANQTANRRAWSIENRFKKMNKTVSATLARTGVSINSLLAIGGTAGAVRAVTRYEDAWTRAGNALAAASQVAGRQARSLSEVNDIAKETRTGLEATAELYARLLRATANVAESEEDVARATELVNKAFKAGGAATSEQTAGILQLSQALGSGLLQGDELRSLRENAPLLAQAIADEFKTTIGGLKELGAAGELTSDRVFKAILKAQGGIERAFNATRATIADNLTLVGNALTEAIGNSEGAEKAFNELRDALKNLADFISSSSFTKGVDFIGDSFAGLAVDVRKAYDQVTKISGVVSRLDFSSLEAFRTSVRSILFDASTGTGLIADQPAARKADKLSVSGEDGDDRQPPPRVRRNAASPSGKKPKQRRLDDLQREIASVNELTAALRQQVATYGETEIAIDKARVAHELEAAARAANVPLSNELISTINQLSEAYAVEAQKLRELNAAQDLVDQANDAFKGTFKSFVQDLVEGKSATEALTGALGRLGDRLLDIGLDAALTALTGGAGGTGSGNLLASLFGFADGGVMTGRGPAPLRKYNSGGVARSPQVALYGEGSRPEAYVPLPDGRSIPVNIDMPNLARMGGTSPGAQMVTVAIAASSDFDARVVATSENVSARVVRRYDQGLPARMADIEARQG